MASRIKLMSLTAAATVGMVGYFVYSVFAVQGQGVLAQAPLNTQVQVPPGFIMALDDSGSMLWEALNNTRDGVFAWNQGQSSFYNGNTPYGYNAGNQNYHFVFPNYGRDSNVAIPPLDAFGFARSPDVNPAYFDPRVVYAPWKTHLDEAYLEIDPTDAPLDPRPAGSPGKINGSIDLTQPRAATANNWRFRLRRNMVIPGGTRVRGECDAEPQDIDADDYVTLPNDRRIDQNSCDLHVEFYPATFYLDDPASLPADYGYVAEPVAVTSTAGRPGTLYKYEIRAANFGSNIEAYNAAIQNFARWFSFYRTRREALIGGATNALAGVNNLRVGWFRISNRVDVTMRDLGADVEKQALFNDIFSNMRASGSTPNRRAVRHLGEQFKRTGGSAPVQLSCQKNAGMLFTDGYINEEGNSPTPGNLDGSRMPTAPFADNVADTVADIVVPYYLDSLNPTMEQNAVPVPAACNTADPDPSLDCQRNLHMNFYAVTLGTLGEKYGVSYVQDEHQPWKTDPDPYDVPPTWAGTRQDLVPQAVDEIWHATINARGEMINATRPADITAAIRRILVAVSAGASPSGTLSLTGSRIGTGSLSVEPFYEARNEGTDWYSYLTARSLTMNPVTREVTATEAWEASDELPAAAARDIWFGSADGVEQFQSANLSGDDLCASLSAGMSLCNPYSSYFGSGGTRINVTLDQAVSYLRGDTSLEVQNGGLLRDRTSRLGDIVNSTPVVSAPTDDYGYQSLSNSTMAGQYKDFLEEKREDRRVMVYTGANDGMLHAFDGGMGADGVMDARGGRERFAYIPQSVLGHMGNLLLPYDAEDEYDQKFQHRYFVDGPVTVGDAYFGSNDWRTVLVASTGAGGRGVFALDVSDAATDGVANAFTSDSRLWEINHFNESLDSNVRDNIGHVLGRPVIVPFKTSTGVTSFKAIFGNGYNSANGDAVLYVVDMAEGEPVVRMIRAEESDPPSSNGLGNLVVVDRWGGSNLTTRARDGFADTVYAADQNGAVWKFDLREDLPAAANGVGSIETPLFTTREHVEEGETYRQPILGGLTASAGPRGGVMLFFGTGSFSFVNDQGDDSIQSLYGILDSDAPETFTRSQLLQQTVGTDDNGVRQVSRHTMSFMHRGWYIDLPAGERAVGYPRVESGVVFVPTYTPDAEGGCSTDGFNSLFGLNALSGAAGLSNVRVGAPDGDSFAQGTGAIGLNTGGSAPVKDVQVMTLPRIPPLGAGADPDDLEEALATQCSMVVQVAGAEPLYLPRACGRQSWRQVQ